MTKISPPQPVFHSSGNSIYGCKLVRRVALLTYVTMRTSILAISAIPFVYYCIALYSSIRFFRSAKSSSNAFAPPVSNLKPVRGLDPEAYDNFASFCRQDYPNYEILFCVTDERDPAYPVLQKLKSDFHLTRIRIVIGSGRKGTN